MSRRRPWRVLFRPESDAQMRSRSFLDEQTALSWAQAYVRDVGDAALAHVGFKEAPDGSSPSAINMPSHIVSMLDGEIVLRSWSGQTEAEAFQQARDAMNGRPNPHGPRVSFARDHPLRALPGGTARQTRAHD